MYFYLFILMISSILNTTSFIKLDNQIPDEINLNDFELFINSNNNQKHYNKIQTHNFIPVFGKNIKIHYNTLNMPSSISLNHHYGQFEHSNPTLTLSDARLIVSNDFSMNEFIYENVSLKYYVKNNIGKLVFHIDAVSFDLAYRYLISAHTGNIIKKWTLIHDEGPTIGTGSNLLGEWVDPIYIYEGNSFSPMDDLITPNLICEEYCWDYGDCYGDGQSYNWCELSYSQGTCEENYIEDCNGNCFHEWYIQFPGVGNGFCNAPWIYALEEDVESGIFNMVDESNPNLGTIYTINSYGSFYDGLSYINSDTTIFSDPTLSTAHQSGVSAHDYQRKTLDYFWDMHQYAGIDGNGKRTISVVNYSSGGGLSQNNAFYNAALDVLSYGVAGGAYRPFCAAQDIVTHEFTHGFTAHTSGLIYENQAGALNESMSDVFGYFVEAEYQNGGDWTEGEDIRINGGASRSFENPPTYGDPDNINHPYFVPYTDNPNMFTNDNGGVHSNSGIPNKVLYLVVKGDEHYGINVLPFEEDINLSRDVASTVWYNWNRYYLEPEDDFAIAREKMIQVVQDVFPTFPMYVQTVSNAWASVGVGNPLILGDLNNDTIINIQDIILIVGILLGSYEPSDMQLNYADVNQDNIVDILDIVLIINIIFN
tara:strand:- start:3 stop:1952 length:1950 start_codon:yes stop_codon:yes gene_type:complete